MLHRLYKSTKEMIMSKTKLESIRLEYGDLMVVSECLGSVCLNVFDATTQNTTTVFLTAEMAQELVAKIGQVVSVLEVSNE